MLAVLSAQACQHRSVEPATASQEQVDMTPWERSDEVQALFIGTFVPDPGEPAGAVKTFLTTREQLSRAWDRINGQLPQGEPDFDPHALLDEALRVQRRSTVLYPMSRHAWQGVGEVLWRGYQRQPRRADLREAVAMYIKAAELLVPLGTHGTNDRAFDSLASNVARALVVLSDTPALDAFFAKVKGTSLWAYSRNTYVVALGQLNDPRADGMFREMLAEDPRYPWYYIEYLIDRGRYQDALDLLDHSPRPPGRPHMYPGKHARRGALLERLGRPSEAEVEYRLYWNDAPRYFFSDRVSPLPERDRVPGSVLQTGMKFLDPDWELPRPPD
jgi:hypothetical protein